MGTELKSMGATNIVARHIWPGAFQPYDKWSSNIADNRQKARLAAQQMKTDDPDRFREIVKTALKK